MRAFASTERSDNRSHALRAWLVGDGTPASVEAALRGLVGSVFGLVGIGLVGAASFASPGGELLAVQRHALFLGVGLLAFLGACRLPLRAIANRGEWLIGACALLLLSVFAFPTLNEARRWILLGPVSFQPSELAKLVLVIYVAGFVARHGDRLRDFRGGFLVPLSRIGLVVALILFEPDFGTATFLLVTCSLMLLLGGARWSHFAAVALGCLPLMIAVAWTQFDHVATRFRMLFQDSSEVLQISRGHLALAVGGLGGEGVGRGILKLGLVPEGRNDFVFAQLGEEWGLLGTGLVILLFAAVALHGIRILCALRDTFAAQVVFGCLFLLCFQALLNLGVVTKLLPPKGIALPFVSAGGVRWSRGSPPSA